MNYFKQRILRKRYPAEYDMTYNPKSDHWTLRVWFTEGDAESTTFTGVNRGYLKAYASKWVYDTRRRKSLSTGPIKGKM